jgi:hypothetical protein
MKKLLALLATAIVGVACLSGCDVVAEGTNNDTKQTLDVGNKLAANQPTPTDIDYSLERYNLIRRAYWVNGQREKAIALPCPMMKPLGYIVLITESGAVLGNFIVDGKVSSLNSYLTPDSEWYEQEFWSDGDSFNGANNWLPDVDGSYGSNDNGIFFFTPDGKYIEWTGTYFYSDIPFTIDDPVLKMA